MFRYLLILAVLLPSAAWGYNPGTGSVFTEDFDGTLDPDWEMGNGLGSPSPWTQVADGADQSFYADGIGPFGSSPTLHWARHFVHPVTATSFSAAFEFETERGAGYTFDFEVQQRAPTLRQYRMRVDGDGVLSLWRTEGGLPVQQVASGNNAVAKNQKRWLRFAIEPSAGSGQWVRARVWNGNAGSEPSSWTIEFLDDAVTLERVHRIDLNADGPRGIETWIDDLDVWGDAGDGVASSVQTVYVVEWSHLDIGFTEPPDDIEAFAKTHLDQVLNNLEADPDYHWMIETAWFLDKWWERSTETERQRMVSHLQGDRLTLAAGYVNLHTTLTGHEQLTRNAYWSSRFSAEHGVPARVWITDDVPGTSFAVPEILARSGIDYFFGGMNCTFGGQVDAPHKGEQPFWWVGPDGSRVLAWTTFNSYAEAFQWGFSFFDNLAAMYDKVAQRLPELEEVGYPYPEFMLPRAFDNHYQGFHARNLVNQWNASYDNPVFVLSSPEKFLDHMRATYGDEAFPSYSGDYGGAWAGSRGGAPHTQRLIRQSHRDGRAAEALLATGTAIDGQPAPRASMDLLYRKMLESDEHTGAGGWPGYFSREEMDRNNRIHLGYAQDAAAEASSLLQQGLDRSLAELSAAGDAVVAVNPLGRARSDLARIVLPSSLFNSEFRLFERQSGTEVVYQKLPASSEILFVAEAVPAFGYRVFDLVPGAPTAVPSGTLAVTATTLENDAYLVQVDPATGNVTSLFDKLRGQELIDGASGYDFNELASSTKQQYDSQQPPTAEPPVGAAVSIGWNGPVAVSLEVTRTGSPLVTTSYVLHRGLDRFTFDNVIDRDLTPYVPSSLGVRAYTVTLPFDVHDFEIRSETTTRFLDPVGDGFARSAVFDWHNAEHSIALYDDQKGVAYAVDAVGAHHLENLSSLTSAAYSNGDALLLSRMYDRSDEYTFDDDTVGPFTAEPDTSPILHFSHHVRGIETTFDPVTVSRFGFEALTPLETRLLSRGPGNLPADRATLIEGDAPNVLLYTVKPADDGDGMILRMNELTGIPTTVRIRSDVLALSNPERVEQDEEGGTPLSLDGDGFLVDLTPYETATVRVRAAPGWTPIVLHADKDRAGGAVVFSWSGGVSPYTLTRADSASFSGTTAVLVDEQAVTEFDDPVLADGNTWYYLAE